MPMPITDSPMEAQHQERAPERSPIPRAVAGLFAILRDALGKAEDEREVVHEADSGVSHQGSWHLQVTVEPDEIDGGFVAECLDVPGAMAQGETEEEALEALSEALQGIVAVRMERQIREIDFELPRAKTRARVVEITL